MWLPIVAVLAVVLGPIQRAILEEIVRNARDMPPEARDVLENMGQRGVGGYLLLFLFQLVGGSLFAAIGGILGAMYFKKEVPPALGGNWIPPLPPQ